MKIAMVFLAGLLCSLAAQNAKAAPTLSPSSITFGSTFTTKPQTIQIGAVGTLSISYSAPWITNSAPVKVSSQVINGQTVDTYNVGIYANVALVPNVSMTTVYFVATDNTGSGTMTILTKCGTSSNCGGGSTAPIATPPPSSTPSATPPSVASGTPAPTAPPIASSTPPTTVTPPVFAGPITPSVRPLPLQHISLKLGDQNPFKWCRVPDVNGNWVAITANQSCMDSMEESRTAALHIVMRYIRQIPGGDKHTADAINVSEGLAHVFRDLNPVYQIHLALRDGAGGTWSTLPRGKHYAIENYIMKDLQKFLVSQSAAVVANPPAKDILDFLDLKIANGRVVVGADFTLPQPTVAYDRYVMNEGPITADHMMAPLTNHQLELLEAATEAHEHGSDNRCGAHEDTPNVQLLLQAFENSARNEEEKHFFTMMPFLTGTDDQWTTDEKCQIGKLEHFWWDKWQVALKAGRWAESRNAEIAHQQAHSIMGFKHPDWLYRFPCGTSTIDKCLVENQTQVIERIRVEIPTVPHSD